MAEKLTDRDLFVATLDNDDLIHVVDVSDITQDAAGSSFKLKLQDLSVFINSTANNIYNSNGTISAHRTVDQDNKKLSFINGGLGFAINKAATSIAALEVGGVTDGYTAIFQNDDYTSNILTVHQSGVGIFLAGDPQASFHAKGSIRVDGASTNNEFNFDGLKSFGYGVVAETATKVFIKGVDSTSANKSLKIVDSASSPLFFVRNDGFIMAGVSSPAARFHFKDPANTTTQDAMMIEANYSTSAYNTHYAHFRGFNSSMGVGDVTRLFASSNNPGYDLACFFVEEYAAGGYGAWHFTTRDGAAQSLGLKVWGAGQISLPNVQVGNGGLASGDIYFDTAANALANGDKIAIRKT